MDASNYKAFCNPCYSCGEVRSPFHGRHAAVLKEGNLPVLGRLDQTHHLQAEGCCTSAQSLCYS